MRIGFFFRPANPCGWRDAYVADLVEAAAALGHVPIVFAMAEDAAELPSKNVETHVYAPPRLLPAALRLRLFHGWLVKEAPRHALDLTIGFGAGGLPDVLVMRNVEESRLLAVCEHALPLDQIVISLEKEACAKASRVIAHSSRIREELIASYGVPPERIRVVRPPFQEPAACSLTRRELRDKYDVPQDRTVFLFPSFDVKGNGFDFLKRYFTSNPHDFMLLAVGRPVTGNRFIKSIPRPEDMADLYRLADYTLLAAPYDPVGTIARESAACGTPVVAAENIGEPGELPEGASRTFSPLEINSLGLLMDELAKNPLHLMNTPRSYQEHTPQTHLQKVLSEAINID